METSLNEWRKAEDGLAVSPSLEFIRAVADLLETSPEDILAEMGYTSPSENERVLSEV
ncbi:MAG: hypothetical protein H7308_00030 [Chthonomonadaceae bacterium]|nr:hypothetical protein [Chthonomonadaceae bacterium]